ncbi:MAG: hypothetical protein RIT28_1892, partial [Pseudomonadota bacterium]
NLLGARRRGTLGMVGGAEASA